MRLKRQLGLFTVTISAIGIILGAGIYALIGEAAGISGYWIWLGFVVAALVAMFTGLSYAELSSMIPKAGAEFDYSKAAFGRKVGFFTAWILALAGFISAAAVAWGFGNYFHALTGFSAMYSAIGLMVVCAIVIYAGVKQATTIAGAMTIIEILGLVIVVVAALPLFLSGRIPAQLFDFTGFSITPILQTAALLFFAFIGFEEITRLSEETKNARENIPKALLAAIFFSTVIYILVAIAAVTIVTPAELAQSSAPLGLVVGTVLGSEGFFALSLIALAATASTVLLIMLATSRLIYGIAEDNALPKFIAEVDKKTNTPTTAILITAAAAIIFVFFGNISTVASATDFLLFIAFIIVNLSVIQLRFTQPNAKRPFRIPLSVGNFPLTAAFGIAACIILIASTKIEVIIVGSALVIIGIVFEAYYSKNSNFAP